ncbi:MAG: neuraminidase-like domain-containing protein, partial [Bacteroidota bacterium]
IQEENRVDAAIQGPDGSLYLLAGDQYYRYSDLDYVFVDAGYPKLIAEELVEEWSLTELPGHFSYDVDAAMWGSDQQFYLFKQNEFVSSQQPGPQPIADHWGNASHVFASEDPEGKVALDAIFRAPSGELYLFKGEYFLRYSDPHSDAPDEGYPLRIKDQWGALDPGYELGISSAFVFEGKTYLVLEDGYVRYPTQDYTRPDNIQPHSFTELWGEWNDYRLADLKVIGQYQALVEASPAQAGLSDLFDPMSGAAHEVYERLSEMFDWAKDDVQWLKRHQVFLGPSEADEPLNLEQLIRLSEIMQVINKTGSYPADVYEQLWIPRFGEGRNYSQAADSLYRYLGSVNGASDWDTLERQIRDELNTLRRDALLPYLIHHWSELYPDQAPVEDRRDVYERLLIDVDMESCGETSYVKEAISAVQLYLHRYLLNLEALELKSEEEEQARQELKEQWQWMKSYRVWEANRKVFLFPENYLRPELRGDKTPGFQTLEEELLQSNLDEKAITRAYKKYLDQYTEVSRLTIAGGYVYDDPNELYSKALVLFGHTKSDPATYYYRTASFDNGESNSVTWEPWRDTGLQISSRRVYPVFAFGRIFVFWLEEETRIIESESAELDTVSSDDKITVSRSENQKTHEYYLHVRYSYYNLNEEWVPPQQMDNSVRTYLPIQEGDLLVENSQAIDGNPHENIIVKLSYKQGFAFFPAATWASGGQVALLTPELETKLAPGREFAQSGLEVFQGLFADAEVANILQNGKVVQLNTFENSTEGPWFSFDLKGGSFLCKPTAGSLNEFNEIQRLSGNDAALPEWDHLDAAFSDASGTSFYFHNDYVADETTPQDVFVSSSESGLTTPKPIGSRFGRARNKVAADQRVDAAWNQGETFYLIRGNEALPYSNGSQLADPPIALTTLLPGLPSAWTSLDAILNLGTEGLYVFKGAEYVLFPYSSGSLQVNNTPVISSISDFFGGNRNSINDGSLTIPVNAAFVYGGKSYLLNEQEFVRYSGADFSQIEAGYPKPNTLANLLTDLGLGTLIPEGKESDAVAELITDGHDLILLTGPTGMDLIQVTNDVLTDRPDGVSWKAGFVYSETVYFFSLNDGSVPGNPSALFVYPVTGPIDPSPEVLSRQIDAAFIDSSANPQVHLFSGNEFISFPASEIS